MNTQNEKFLKLFETYIQNVPFLDRLFIHHYDQISTLKNGKQKLEEYRQFSKWFEENKESVEVLKILEDNKLRNIELNQIDDEKWANIRNTTKLAFPTAEDMEYVPLFDNDDNRNNFLGS